MKSKPASRQLTDEILSLQALLREALPHLQAYHADLDYMDKQREADEEETPLLGNLRALIARIEKEKLG